MAVDKVCFIGSRRQLLLGALPAGTLFCLGCANTTAPPQEPETKEAPSDKHKFQLDSEMTVEEVFKFAYTDNFIPLMQSLAEEIGKEKLMDMLKQASGKITAQGVASMTADLPQRDFTAWVDFTKKILEQDPYKKALTHEIVEETDKVLEVRYTECLWAKTFREANASDIGYAVQCSGGSEFVAAFNPNIKLTHPKNLMLGDDVCIERYTWEV